MTFTFQWGHFWLGFVAVLFGQWFVLALLLLRYKLKHPDGAYITGWYRGYGDFYVRVWGFGLRIRDVNRWRLLFSEREGHRNFIMLRGHVIRMLWP